MTECPTCGEVTACILCESEATAAVTWRCTAGSWARLQFPAIRDSWLVTDPLCAACLPDYFTDGYDVQRIWGITCFAAGELTYQHRLRDGLPHHEAAALAVRMHDAVRS